MVLLRKMRRQSALRGFPRVPECSQFSEQNETSVYLQLLPTQNDIEVKRAELRPPCATLSKLPVSVEIDMHASTVKEA